MKRENLHHLTKETAINIAEAAIARFEAYDPPSNPMTLEDITGSQTPEDIQLESLLKNLTGKEMAELTALFNLGRKTNGQTLKKWEELRQHDGSHRRSVRHNIVYLCDKLTLGEDLINGLKEIGAIPR